MYQEFLLHQSKQQHGDAVRGAEVLQQLDERSTATKRNTEIYIDETLSNLNKNTTKHNKNTYKTQKSTLTKHFRISNIEYTKSETVLSLVNFTL